MYHDLFVAERQVDRFHHLQLPHRDEFEDIYREKPVFEEIKL